MKATNFELQQTQSIHGRPLSCLFSLLFIERADFLAPRDHLFLLRIISHIVSFSSEEKLPVRKQGWVILK